ncbi:MAG: hypothetical protein K9I82_15790 [Chitinophagaceae bacterium]|nr:hypothetical protein [Chitinophagaceae bacterium]
MKYLKKFENWCEEEVTPKNKWLGYEGDEDRLEYDEDLEDESDEKETERRKYQIEEEELEDELPESDEDY